MRYQVTPSTSFMVMIDARLLAARSRWKSSARERLEKLAACIQYSVTVTVFGALVATAGFDAGLTVVEGLVGLVEVAPDGTGGAGVYEVPDGVADAAAGALVVVVAVPDRTSGLGFSPYGTVVMLMTGAAGSVPLGTGAGSFWAI